jgi:hypothetical protein
MSVQGALVVAVQIGINTVTAAGHKSKRGYNLAVVAFVFGGLAINGDKETVHDILPIFPPAPSSTPKQCKSFPRTP